ncbi:SET domain-containing protein [Periconia macrospinosa]|uniref:SET domain-containing protein n=1 Tax=Periconia macrospinosa TaxID=97972 RepID=A0A2V1E5T7_9PLEO|nr:SET domain-containing protein [Periconia macrospinosa]
MPATSSPAAIGEWSDAPDCLQGREGKKYCVHTTSRFRGGGLSIISTPEAAEAASSAFAYARKQAHYPHDEWLEVKDIPGKGKGLVAKEILKKGKIIMVDAARVITSSKVPFYLQPGEGLNLYNSAVERLPPKDRALVLDLDKSKKGTGVDDILKTNSFGCIFPDGSEGEGDGYLCLFPLVSRINHACRPNANAKFMPRSLLMEIKALRDIQPGEEISISYGRIDLKHAERQDLYQKGWHFTCTCSLCTADAYAISGSDQRRKRFTWLREQLNSLTSETYDTEQVLAWEKEVLEISEKEGFEVLIAEDLERMAYVYNGLGKKDTAIMWAKRAKKNLLNWTVVDGGLNNELDRIDALLRELGV